MLFHLAAWTSAESNHTTCALFALSINHIADANKTRLNYNCEQYKSTELQLPHPHVVQKLLLGIIFPFTVLCVHVHAR